MKFKTQLTILGISLLTTISAQEVEKKSPWSFGIKAGINTMEADYNGINIGFNLGGTVDYDLGKRLFLRSGLELTSKSAYSSYVNYGYYNKPSLSSSSDTNEFNRMDGDRSTLFLQIPLTMGYRLPISKEVNLTFNAGIFGGIGLSSSGHYQKWTDKYTMDENGEKQYSESTNEYGDLDSSGHFDFGLMGGVGVEYKKFSYNLNYEHGLINQGTKTYKDMGGEALKNRTVTLSATYRF